MLGFQAFRCTDVGDLVCGYGGLGVQMWGIWCAVMGSLVYRYGILNPLEIKGFLHGVQMWGIWCAVMGVRRKL